MSSSPAFWKFFVSILPACLQALSNSGSLGLSSPLVGVKYKFSIRSASDFLLKISIEFLKLVHIFLILLFRVTFGSLKGEKALRILLCFLCNLLIIDEAWLNPSIIVFTAVFFSWGVLDIFIISLIISLGNVPMILSGFAFLISICYLTINCCFV